MKDSCLCSISGCLNLRVDDLPYCTEHILNRNLSAFRDETKYIRSFLLSPVSSRPPTVMYIVMSNPSDFKPEFLSKDAFEAYNNPSIKHYVRRPSEVPALMRSYVYKWRGVYPLGDERLTEKNLQIDRIILSMYK